MQRAFHLYGESRGNIDKVRKGLLISTVSGTTAYALAALEPRGTLFVGPACEVYAGMIVGEHTRENDLEVMTCACMRSRHSSHRRHAFPLRHPPANSSPNTVFKTRSPSMARFAPVCATSGMHEPYARAIPHMKSSANSRGITLRKAETLSVFRAESANVFLPSRSASPK